MKPPKSAFWLIPTALVLLTPAHLAAAPEPELSTASGREDLAVTVYNENLGLVKDTRRVSVGRGQFPLRFSDVASQIDATSVSFRSLSDPAGVEVLEQNYEYDLITPGKLMEKYVGRQVEIQLPPTKDGPAPIVKATLISTNEGYVYRIGDKIHLQPPGQVILPDLPPDLVARPSLVWLLDSRKTATHTIEAGYMTGGMAWQADYVVVSRQDNKQADMTGWVTITNNSGATYPNARLTLVAGDVNRAQPDAPPRPVMEDRAATMAKPAAPQFSQQALFEYHSYDLNRRATLKNNETKQLTLLTADDFTTRKVYVYDSTRQWWHGADDGKKVKVMLEYWNKKDNRLGMPLPRGRVRVYQEDAHKKLQFIGEDRIDHTPKDEKVRVLMGNAFDIVGERRQLSVRNLSDRMREESYEVKLRNHKDAPVEVSVVERVWGDWQVVKKSHPFNRLSSTELEFPVKVPANGETKVTYTVRLTY